jgi:hypothetical protein
MRPLSQTLTDLITVANDTVTRRGMQNVIGGHFALLADEIRQAEARPAENIRTTRAAMIMVFALEEFADGPHDAGSPWLMLAGTTLPLLRVDAWRALQNEKQARGQS